VKSTTFKAILFVIIPVVILLGVGIYFMFQIPQIRYGLQKDILHYMVDKKLRQGKLSQAHAVQLKEAFDRLFTVLIKLKKNRIDQQTIDNEIGRLVIEKQIGPNIGIPKDDEVEEVTDLLNEASARLEELVKNYNEKSK
jgi:hypothetical protein